MTRYIILWYNDAYPRIGEGEGLLEEMADLVPNILFILDGEGIPIYQNKSWCDYTGIPAIEKRLNSGIDLIHPEDRARILAIWDRALLTKTPFTAQYRLRDRDGNYAWFILNMHFLVFHGEHRWFGCATNVDRQVELERGYRVLANRWKRLINFIPSMVFTADRGGRITHVNDRWTDFMGVEFCEYNKSPCDEFIRHHVHPDDFPVALGLAKKFAGTEDFEAEYRLKDRHGVYNWIMLRATLIDDFWYGVLTNIDGQKKVQEERLKLLAVVSHDLNNPLTSAFLSTHLAKRTCQDPKILKLLDTTALALNQMRDLVVGLFDLANVEAGKTLNFQIRDIVLTAQEVYNVFLPIAKENGIILSFLSTDATLDVRHDRVKIQRAISNLVGNAIKFLNGYKKDGHIVIGIKRQGNRVLVNVQDNGPGIPLANQNLIFNTYWQASKKREGSAGLGLAVVKSVVEAHGGNVSLVSLLGAGCNFIMDLPAA